ncbi:MAG: hypothetical protein KDK34_03020 [Leptospiraceae bacterium]|nr:hypothetical protein [Leptospiraceae bacterium]
MSHHILNKTFLTILTIGLISLIFNCRSLESLSESELNSVSSFDEYRLVINYTSIESNLLVFSSDKESYEYLLSAGGETGTTASIREKMDIVRSLLDSTIQNTMGMRTHVDNPAGYVSVLIRQAEHHINGGWMAGIVLFGIIPLFMGAPVSEVSTECEVEVAVFDERKQLLTTLNGKGQSTEYMAFYYGYDQYITAAGIIALRNALIDARSQMEAAL